MCVESTARPLLGWTYRESIPHCPGWTCEGKYSPFSLKFIVPSFKVAPFKFKLRDKSSSIKKDVTKKWWALAQTESKQWIDYWKLNWIRPSATSKTSDVAMQTNKILQRMHTVRCMSPLYLLFSFRMRAVLQNTVELRYSKLRYTVVHYPRLSKLLFYENRFLLHNTFNIVKVLW